MTVRAKPETVNASADANERPQFELFVDRRGDFRFRYKTESNRVVFSSAPYPSRTEALKAIESIRRNAGTASIQGRKPTLIDHILSGPEWPEDMYEIVNRRSKTPSREPIEF